MFKKRLVNKCLAFGLALSVVFGGMSGITVRAKGSTAAERMAEAQTADAMGEEAPGDEAGAAGATSLTGVPEEIGEAGDECPSGQVTEEVQEYGELLVVSEKDGNSENIARSRKEQKAAEKAAAKAEKEAEKAAKEKEKEDKEDQKGQDKQDKKDGKEQDKADKEQHKEERKLAKKLDKEKHEKISAVNSVDDHEEFWNIVSVGGAESETGVAVAADLVKVAILDSGVDYTSDIDVYMRKNFVPGEDDISVIYEDISGHGTSVAGIIAAKDNDEGITGINPGVQLYSARILDADKQAPASRVVEAIDWAISQDVDIINISFGTAVDVEEIHAAIKRAYDAGILIVAAAGNNGVVEYPAAYDEVVAVGAVDAKGERAEGSAVGDELELVAPGQQIVSTGAFGGVCVVGGTSLAAPHVTAVASVLWQKDKSVSADFIRSLLAFSANQYGEDYEYGNGLVDLNFALSQYDAFREVYAKDADVLNEQVRDAVADGALAVNEKPVEEFGDVVYVEGSWKMADHQTLAGVDSIVSGNPLSTAGLKVVKLGAARTDRYFTYMTYYPELHGFTSRQPGGKENFEYYSNYVYSYIYLTEIASQVYNGQSISPAGIMPEVKATCIGSCAGHNKAGKMCVEQSAEHIRNCFIGNTALNDDGGTTWSEVLEDVGDSNKNRGLFIYGMALHTITDLFAHSAWRVSTGQYITHPDADTIIAGETRYDCAKLAAQYVVSHIKRQEFGNVLDFYYAIEKESNNPTFSLRYLNQYIKAVSLNDYKKYQEVFDNMTYKKDASY
ncbi:MAG: S8 family peptidase [Lachnospiraceae bacterium]|nr:S8 family peptidase [Lachnospiraceae bacterium]